MVPRYVADLKPGVSDAPLAASGLDLAHTPESRALIPSTASLIRRVCLRFDLADIVRMVQSSLFHHSL